MPGQVIKPIHLLLLFGLGVCIFQVWWPAYYVTGDGPSHLYNAQLLHDIWVHKNTALYAQWFTLVYKPDPNWLATFVLAVLLFVAKGAVAEKIALTCYVITYISGFWLLLKKISAGKNDISFWALALLFFVFPHTLAKGFYNFSFSIAFYFWVVWLWLCFLERKTVGRGALFFLFTGMLFFTHLLSFGFGMFTCAALSASYSLATVPGRQKWAAWLKNTAWQVGLVAPFLLLMQWFTDKEGGLQLALEGDFYRLIELAQMKYLVTMTQAESNPAVVGGVTLVLLSVVALALIFRRLALHRYDGLLLSLFFALFVYVFFPESFLGRLILIGMRAQLYVGILMTCFIAYRMPPGKLKNLGGIVLFGCFAGLSMAHIWCMRKAGAAIADYTSAAAHIRPQSVVLPFNFAPNGRDDQNHVIADRNYLFSHLSQYLGVMKPLIVLDNYEANMGYFPLHWVEERNPYYKMGRDGNIEGCPPAADIKSYQAATGASIDYILLWCYDSSWLPQGNFRPLYEQIQAGYHLAYTSPSGHALLYEKNAH